MRNDELIKLKNALFEESNKLTILKSRGYGTEGDSLMNLKLVEFMGVVPAEIGAWVRLSDKVARTGRILLRGEEYVSFEGLIDTVVDGINYFTMIPALKCDKDENFKKKFYARFGLENDGRG